MQIVLSDSNYHDHVDFEADHWILNSFSEHLTEVTFNNSSDPIIRQEYHCSMVELLKNYPVNNFLSTSDTHSEDSLVPFIVTSLKLATPKLISDNSLHFDSFIFF